MSRAKAAIYLVGLVVAAAGVACVHWPAGLVVFGAGLMFDAARREAPHA